MYYNIDCMGKKAESEASYQAEKLFN